MSATRGGDGLRVFRVITIGAHLLFSTAFSGLIIYSVFKSVLEMTPGRVPPGPEVYSLSQCVQGGEALLDELDRQRRAFGEGVAAQADRRFMDFRADWLTRKGRLEAGCGLERVERGALRDFMRALDGLVDLYTTESVQFAGSLGIEVDRARALLRRLEPVGAAGRTAP